MCQCLINKPSIFHLLSPQTLLFHLPEEEADQRLRTPSEGEAGQISVEMEIKR